MTIEELRQLPPTLTVEEAGKLLGVSRHAGYAAARVGEPPTITIGRRLIVPTTQLLTLLERTCSSPRRRHPAMGNPT
jgi:hypothetical protein